MNSENEEIGDSEEPIPLPTWRSNLHKKFQHYLDRSVPHLLRRWLVTIGVAMIYILRVYWFKGFHVISYGLATYLLNLLIGFFSPNVDPGLEGVDGAPPSPVSPGRDNDEYKPFERRVPEFRFWYNINDIYIATLMFALSSVVITVLLSPHQTPLPYTKLHIYKYAITKAFIVAFMLTFISVLDVPVFWPILSSYWAFLFVLTMIRQIVHMIKYKYNPFSTGKPKHKVKK